MKFTVKLPGAAGIKGKGLSGRKLLRMVRRGLGYFALFVFVFVFATWLSLPTDAIAWRIGHEARKAGYAIDVRGVSVSPFGGITLEEVTWIYEPSRPGQIPENFYLEEVDIDISLLSLIIGRISVEVDSAIDDATIHAEYRRSSSESTIKFEVNELPLYEVPKVRQAVNAPLTGLFGVKVDLTMAENKWVNAEGSIEISCAACTVGDGETLMYVPGVKRGLLVEGLTLPEIELGSLGGTLQVANGLASTEGIETTSKDLQAKLTGTMDLNDPFKRSRVDFQIKFFLTDALREKSEKLNLMVQTADPKARLEGEEEGWLAYSLYGSISRPRFVPKRAKSKTDSRRERREREKQKAADREKKKRKKSAAKKPAKKPAKPTKPKDTKKDAMDRNDVASPREEPKEEPEELKEEPEDRPALPSEDSEKEENGDEAEGEPEPGGSEGEGQGEGEVAETGETDQAEPRGD